VSTSFARRLPLLAPAPLVLQAHQAQPSLPDRQNETLAPAVILARMPELTWRTPQRQLGEAEAPVVTSAKALAAAFPERTHAAMSAAQAAASPPAPAAAKPGAAALDRAQMDRLAEDVIRRVERRVRIERERRGL
jgi:hypothetical protein